MNRQRKWLSERIAYEIVNVGSIFTDRPDEPLCDFDSGHKIIDGECIDLRDDEGREIRGRGTAPDGTYNIDNCTGQDCADADKETKQEEESEDDSPAYVPPSEEEDENEGDQDAGIGFNDPPLGGPYEYEYEYDDEDDGNNNEDEDSNSDDQGGDEFFD